MLTFAFSNKYGILYGTWPYRLTARTRAFQALNQGSIPCRVTNSKKAVLEALTSVNDVNVASNSNLVCLKPYFVIKYE